MGTTDNLIRSTCPLFACRICRTKTGWPHQSWCGAAAVTQPGCPDCRYWDTAGFICAHPVRGKRGGV